MESATIQQARFAALIANCLFSCVLFAVLAFYLFWMVRVQRSILTQYGKDMYQIRRRLKRSRYTLDEFLGLCSLLGISREEITEIYQEMHRKRREIGESWLFDTKMDAIVNDDRPTTTTADSRRSKWSLPKQMDRRQIPIFRSFASGSQFTQGFDGFRTHRLLHAYRPSEYIDRDTPEMNTFYLVSEMCSTMRKTDEQIPNKRSDTIELLLAATATPPKKNNENK